MSFAISMHAPLHSPLARSFWKYGSSPGSAAIRKVLVRRIRSNVLSLADCARAPPIKLAAGNSAAAPASARRPSRVVMVWCLPEFALAILIPNPAKKQDVEERKHVLPLSNDRRRHPARSQRGWHRLAHTGPDLYAASGDGEQFDVARAAASRHLRAAAHPSDSG